MRPCIRLPFIVAFLLSTANAQSFVSRWLDGVARAQAEQPHWVAPVITTSARLDQRVRYDILSSQNSSGTTWNFGNGKGLDLVLPPRMELILGVPPYVVHDNASADGFGDVNLQMKFRLISRSEQKGNYVVSLQLGGTIPTGSYHNGSPDAVVTPTLAGGKGWGRWNVQSAFGVALPVSGGRTSARPLQFNTALEYHAQRFLWPEIEANYTYFKGGSFDGHQQLFLSPGLILGRFPIHNRVYVSFGAAFQVAVTHFHATNHNVALTFRLPF